jgi:tetratricopeptide (TPR) repeat protein
LLNPLFNGIVLSRDRRRVDEVTNFGQSRIRACEISPVHEVIKVYDGAIEINPQNLTAWNGKGLALYKSNKYDETITAYDKAIEINPQYPKAWYLKGIDLRKLGKFREAVTALNKAIKIGPHHSRAWYNKNNLSKYTKSASL